MIRIVFILFVFLSCCGKNTTTFGPANEHSQRIPDSIADKKLLSLYFDAENDKIYMKYMLQKIQFLVLYNDTNSAIDVIEGDSCNMWETIGGPYYKKILEHRILAMSAKIKNDQQLYEANIMEALKLVEKYISDNKEEYVLFLRNDLQHQRGKYIITTQEYIYYSYLLYGKDRSNKILEEYQDLYHIPENAIEQLKLLYHMDIMDFYPW